MCERPPGHLTSRGWKRRPTSISTPPATRCLSRSSLIWLNPMHSITLNQNWKKVRVTLDPPQKGPSIKGNEPILISYRFLLRWCLGLSFFRSAECHYWILHHNYSHFPQSSFPPISRMLCLANDVHWCRSTCNDSACNDSACPAWPQTNHTQTKCPQEASTHLRPDRKCQR